MDDVMRRSSAGSSSNEEPLLARSVGLNVRRVYGGGVVAVYPGRVVASTDRALRALTGIAEIVHTSADIQMTTPRVAPPWRNAAVVLRDPNAPPVVVHTRRRAMRSALTRAGFQVEERRTWLSMSGGVTSPGSLWGGTPAASAAAGGKTRDIWSSLFGLLVFVPGGVAGVSILLGGAGLDSRTSWALIPLWIAFGVAVLSGLSALVVRERGLRSGQPAVKAERTLIAIAAVASAIEVVSLVIYLLGIM